MRLALLPLAASLALAAAAQPPGDPPDPRTKDAEALPAYPKADPNSKVIENPEKKGLVLEVLPDKTTKRVGVTAEVCLVKGPLELFACRQGTKEHEAVVRLGHDARDIHQLLLLAGATPGAPAQFVDPKTNEPAFKPATGSKVRVLAHYTKGGKPHTHPVQEWVWNSQAKKPLAADWVFAGSKLLTNPDRPDDPPYYAANSSDVIAISNSPYSMLELPIEVSRDDALLNYEIRTEKLPPLGSKVWLILEPVPAKK
ncbi:MAG: YdjY domain-containing protein [Gemmataceae bacterium]|nr:YdjY domain-containing protein [Gemmataceae bacterium]